MNFRDRIIAKRKRGKKRGARGFSREELGKLGIGTHQALKLKLPIDLRRRSIHEENLAFLRQQLKTEKTRHRKVKLKKETARRE